MTIINIGIDVVCAEDGVVGIADAVIANRTPAEVMVDVDRDWVAIAMIVVVGDNADMVYDSCNVVYKQMFDDLT